jgi:hypothetical protein
MVRIVLEDGTDLPDGKVQTLLEIDKCLGTPNLPGDLRAGNDFPLAADQQDENLGRLRLELERGAPPAKFPRAQVKFEVAKADNVGGTNGRN